MSDQLGLVFGALSDPTRRLMVQKLAHEGSTSVPALTGELPMTRQAIAKHLSALDHAGLIERVPPDHGREVRYRLRPGALHGAASWLSDADAAWAGRLDRLKSTLEADGS